MAGTVRSASSPHLPPLLHTADRRSQAPGGPGGGRHGRAGAHLRTDPLRQVQSGASQGPTARAAIAVESTGSRPSGEGRGIRKDIEMRGTRAAILTACVCGIALLAATPAAAAQPHSLMPVPAALTFGDGALTIDAGFDIVGDRRTRHPRRRRGGQARRPALRGDGHPDAAQGYEAVSWPSSAEGRRRECRIRSRTRATPSSSRRSRLA